MLPIEFLRKVATSVGRGSGRRCDVKMAPPLKLNAIAFISPQNHPILIRTTAKDELKYHYIAHTSLDVIEERGESCAVFRCRSRRTGGFVANSGNKSTDCYLGLLYAMEDVAVYGYMTPLKVKIVLALALSDNVVRDAEVCMIFKALHMAYYSSISNPFLKLDAPTEEANDQYPLLLVGGVKWKGFRKRVDEISRVVGASSYSV